MANGTIKTSRKKTPLPEFATLTDSNRDVERQRRRERVDIKRDERDLTKIDRGFSTPPPVALDPPRNTPEPTITTPKVDVIRDAEADRRKRFEDAGFISDTGVPDAPTPFEQSKIAAGPTRVPGFSAGAGLSQGAQNQLNLLEQEIGLGKFKGDDAAANAKAAVDELLRTSTEIRGLKQEQIDRLQGDIANMINQAARAKSRRDVGFEQKVQEEFAPRRAELGRQIGAQETEASIGAALRGTARGSREFQRQLVREDINESRRQALAASEAIRRQQLIAQAEQADAETINELGRRFNAAEEARLKMEEELAVLDREEASETLAFERQKELKGMPTFAQTQETLLNQVKLGGADAAELITPEDEKAAGFVPGFFKNIYAPKLRQLGTTSPIKAQQFFTDELGNGKIVVLREDGSFQVSSLGKVAEGKSDTRSFQDTVFGGVVTVDAATGREIGRAGGIGQLPSKVDYAQDIIPGLVPREGMRTDRHNNPTAFITQVAEQAGLVEGVDYIAGDQFPNNPNLRTALLLGDAVDTTIRVIDNIGFFTPGGKQRWSHTAIPQDQWNNMTRDQKKQTIFEMYQKEGGNGKIFGLEKKEQNTQDIEAYILEKAGGDFKKEFVLREQIAKNGGQLPSQWSEDKIDSLTTALQKEPIYKDAVEAFQGFSTAASGAAQNNGIGDIAMVNGYQRIIDPGATVRGEDITTQEQAVPFLQRVLNIKGKVFEGTRFTPEVRELMLKAVVDQYNSKVEAWNGEPLSRFKSRAERLSIPFELVGEAFETTSVEELSGLQETGQGTAEFSGKTRSEAIKFLQDNGQEVTPENINYILTFQ